MRSAVRKVRCLELLLEDRACAEVTDLLRSWDSEPDSGIAPSSDVNLRERATATDSEA